MQARMKNPVMVLPEAMKALAALGASTKNGSISMQLRELINLRASQINGCSVCVEMHARDLKKNGETDDRLFAVAAWRESPHFTDAERAAFELTEAATRLSDRGNPVSDEIWAEAAKYYDEQALATLVISIAQINLWNRINAATRQIAGAWVG